MLWRPVVCVIVITALALIASTFIGATAPDGPRAARIGRAPTGAPGR